MNLVATIKSATSPIRDLFWSETCTICSSRLGWNEHYVCRSCFYSIPFAPSLEQSLYHLPVFSLGTYDGLLQNMILEFKSKSRWALGSYLADRLLRDAPAECSNWDGIVPVPIHYRREIDRGYNQAFEIGQRLSKGWGIPHLSNVLRRTRNTPRQIGLNSHERRDNVADAFRCIHPSKAVDKRLLVVDDVITTDSTMTECTRILLEAGAQEVMGIALARA